MTTIELLMDTTEDLLAQTADLIMFEHSSLVFELPMPKLFTGLLFARERAKLGQYRRADMPVLDEPDLEPLKAALIERGFADMCDDGFIAAYDIEPTQCQIYVDKSIRGTGASGVAATKEFLQTQHVVIDRTNHLIDGHHRWLSACLIDATMHLPVFKLEYSEAELREMLLDFSDGRHPRNI